MRALARGGSRGVHGYNATSPTNSKITILLLTRKSYQNYNINNTHKKCFQIPAENNQNTNTKLIKIPTKIIKIPTQEIIKIAQNPFNVSFCLVQYSPQNFIFPQIQQ